MILSTVILLGQIFFPGTIDIIKWYHPEALSDLTRFEICIDEQPCITKLPAEALIANDEKTPVGHATYAIDLPPLLTGGHDVVVRACHTRITDCKEEGFSFTLEVAQVAPTGSTVAKRPGL